MAPRGSDAQIINSKFQIPNLLTAMERRYEL